MLPPRVVCLVLGIALSAGNARASEPMRTALTPVADDCQKFQADNDDLLARAYGEDGTTYSAERAGHDFWLTRNGHGAGYWDRDLGAVGDSLTEKAHDYGDADLYRGDDGLIYVS